MASKTNSNPAVIILVTNQKGGSGKTTTAMNLSAAYHEDGKRVLLVDYDPQNTLLGWYGQADEANPIQIPYLNLAQPGIDISDELEQRQFEFDYIVIDGRPNLEISMSALLLLSDIVLVPLQASLADLHSTQGIVKEIRLAQDERPELKFALVLTMVSDKRLQLQFTKDAIKELGYPLCKTMVARRELHTQAYALGQTVFASKSVGYRAAADEARKLAAEVVKLVS
ncbi:MAG TPA: ParA family protein [Paraburkholderia sp.]|uniref:ParA family protein n=1 Tax=Paraburkholderia sp. TaxID=1926495 RepID=UPI002B4704D0|nr:ParA family protein [Paraburkholderia sp.]HKR43340.1 ParA family protein [Paraburkholderia sp.]